MPSSSRVEALTLAPPSEIDTFSKGSARVTSDGHCVTVQGWVIGDSEPIREIEIVEESGRAIVRAPVNMPRFDLVESFGDSAASKAGFRVVLEPRGMGSEILSVRAVSPTSPFPLLASARVDAHSSDSSQTSISLWRKLFDRLLSRKGLSWLVLSISGEAEKVLVGRDRWLFLRRDTNDVIGQHTGRVHLDRKQREAWREVLLRRRAFAEDLDVTWLCVVIPDKESVYPEHLPSEIVPATRRPIHDFLELAGNANAPVLYALTSLMRRKGEWELYPKTDTHWSHRGAYVTYRAICERLAETGIELEPLQEETIRWTEEELPGDLGGKLFPPMVSPMPKAKLSMHAGRLIYDNGIRNHGRVLIFERRDRRGPSCIVFGESFTENLLIFFKETFARLVIVHTSMFVREVVEWERPDVVLSLPLERFLIRVPEDRNALHRLRDTAECKGGELPWPA